MTIRLRFVAPQSTTPGLLRLRFGAGGQAQDAVGELACVLPAPALAPLALAAHGDAAFVVHGALSAALPPPALQLSFEADGRLPPVLGALDAALPAPGLALVPALAGAMASPAHLLAVLPPAALSFAPSAVAHQGQNLALAASLPAVMLAAPAATVDAEQDMALITDTPTALAAPVRQAEQHAASSALAQQSMLPSATALCARMHAAAVLASRAGLPQQETQRVARPLDARWAHGLRVAGRTAAPQRDTARSRRGAVLPVAQALPVGGRSNAQQREMARSARPLSAGQQSAEALARVIDAEFRLLGDRIGVALAMPHTHGIHPPPGYWRPAPGTGPDLRPDRVVLLRFCHVRDGTAHLVFGCRQPGVGPIIIPVRRTYTVLNTVSLTLAGTGQPIEHTGLSLRLDIDSWAWGWSATVPASYLALLRPDPEDGCREVIATINGQPHRLLVETLSRERRFGRAELRIGGRSRAALLASPYSPTIIRLNTEARTAQQLMDDALTDNGVPLGWTLDWQITDWLVDAHAWSHTGSYMDAAVRIAEAAGAVIQPHATADTLRVLPRYPAAPWEWPSLTSDIAIPENVITVEGIDWADKPRHDAVYLAGSILGHVTRNGTAGGDLAPMVTDPLITHPDAARQRGRAILSDTGRQAHIRLSLPVLPETGIIAPGRIIDYTESGQAHRGITRAVDVQAAFPKVMQTITVETHEL